MALTFIGSRRVHRLSFPVALVLALTIAGAGCAARGDSLESGGGVSRPGQPCGSGRVGNLLTPRWQQCWFTAAGGRWRTLHHNLHYDSFVVDVEAANVADAQEIAQRFIDNQPRFRYLTLYAYKEPSTTPGPVRRVSWSVSGGFELLDYDLSKP